MFVIERSREILNRPESLNPAWLAARILQLQLGVPEADPDILSESRPIFTKQPIRKERLLHITGRSSTVGEGKNS